MTDEPVLFSVDDGIATVRLNRPDVANALDLDTACVLRDIAAELSVRNDVDLVLLTSGGKLFCAGGDVAAMVAAPDRGAFVHELASTVHQALITLRALPIPIVAVAQGTAAGAGLGLLLAADIVIASDRARFVSAYGDVGLSPDCGVSALLARTVGVRRAAQFVLTGRALDAHEALAWGLVTDVVAHDELDEAASTLVAALLERPSAALGASALLLRRSAEHSYAEQLRDEADTIARMAVHPDAVARLTAFVSSG